MRPMPDRPAGFPGLDQSGDEKELISEKELHMEKWFADSTPSGGFTASDKAGGSGGGRGISGGEEIWYR